jgi:hypothetical protein
MDAAQLSQLGSQGELAPAVLVFFLLLSVLRAAGACRDGVACADAAPQLTRARRVHWLALAPSVGQRMSSAPSTLRAAPQAQARPHVPALPPAAAPTSATARPARRPRPALPAAASAAPVLPPRPPRREPSRPRRPRAPLVLRPFIWVLRVAFSPVGLLAAVRAACRVRSASH